MVVIHDRAAGAYVEHPGGFSYKQHDDGSVSTIGGDRFDSVESLAKRVEFIRKPQPQVPFGKSEEDRLTGWTRPTRKG